MREAGRQMVFNYSSRILSIYLRYVKWVKKKKNQYKSVNDTVCRIEENKMMIVISARVLQSIFLSSSKKASLFLFEKKNLLCHGVSASSASIFCTMYTFRLVPMKLDFKWNKNERDKQKTDQKKSVKNFNIPVMFTFLGIYLYNNFIHIYFSYIFSTFVA